MYIHKVGVHILLNQRLAIHNSGGRVLFLAMLADANRRGPVNGHTVGRLTLIRLLEKINYSSSAPPLQGSFLQVCFHGDLQSC